MPKMRSHSGTKKRLTITASGKVRRAKLVIDILLQAKHKNKLDKHVNLLLFQVATRDILDKFCLILIREVMNYATY